MLQHLSQILRPENLRNVHPMDINTFIQDLAAIIEYFIGRGLGQITDFDKQRKKLPFGLGKFPANSIWFLIFGRLVPSFGSKVVSIAGGVYHVPLWRYVWTAMVSNLFGSVVLALGGYSLLHTLIK